MENNGLSLQGEIISAPHTLLQTLQGLARKPSEIHKFPSWALFLHVVLVLSHPPSRTLSGVSCQSLWLGLCPHFLSQPGSNIPSGHQLPCSRGTCLGFRDTMDVCFSSFLVGPSSSFFLFSSFQSGQYSGICNCICSPLTGCPHPNHLYLHLRLPHSSSRLNTTLYSRHVLSHGHLSSLLGCLTQLRQII